VQLRYMQTLSAITGDKSNTIVFPLPVDLLTGLVDRQDVERAGLRGNDISAHPCPRHRFLQRFTLPHR